MNLERYWGGLPPGFRAVDLWIGEAEFLGRGIGRAMMRRVFAHRGPLQVSAQLALGLGNRDELHGETVRQGQHFKT